MPRIRTIALQERVPQAFDLLAGDRIACREGLVWITFDGVPGDYLLHAGDTWTAPHRGRVVTQSLRKPAIYRLIDEEPEVLPLAWNPGLASVLRRPVRRGSAAG